MPKLLQWSTSGSRMSKPNSDISDFNHSRSCTVVAIPICLASVLEQETVVCFFEAQDTNTPPKHVKNPVWLFLSMRFPVQSASQQPVISWFVNIPILIPYICVAERYLKMCNMCLTTCQWQSYGATRNWSTLVTEYMMFNHVRVKYWRTPQACEIPSHLDMDHCARQVRCSLSSESLTVEDWLTMHYVWGSPGTSADKGEFHLRSFCLESRGRIVNLLVFWSRILFPLTWCAELLPHLTPSLWCHLHRLTCR